MTNGDRMVGARFLLLSTVFLQFGAVASAQKGAGALSVFGKVRDYDTGDPLVGVVVEARDSLLAETITTTSADSGRYDLELPSGHAFVITFRVPRHVAKSVIVDGRDIPVGGQGTRMNIDITLLERLFGVDYTVMDRPIGRCLYSATEQAFVWDAAFTQALRGAIRTTTDLHQAARAEKKPGEH